MYITLIWLLQLPHCPVHTLPGTLYPVGWLHGWLRWLVACGLPFATHWIARLRFTLVCSPLFPLLLVVDLVMHCYVVRIYVITVLWVGYGLNFVNTWVLPPPPFFICYLVVTHTHVTALPHRAAAHALHARIWFRTFLRCGLRVAAACGPDVPFVIVTVCGCCRRVCTDFLRFYRNMPHTARFAGSAEPCRCPPHLPHLRYCNYALHRATRYPRARTTVLPPTHTRYCR